nr:ribonuclease H-like domain-containing protein [Tanacetum cinerariifolium]
MAGDDNHDGDHPETSNTSPPVVAREKERKTRTTLLMAVPEDHLAKFHKMADEKDMWEANESRFGANDKSKKMQKYLLKQQFEEIHGASVSYEDANQKFLRSLPSSWSQVALIMITKLGLDTFSSDDLYNNLRVFERDVKGPTTSLSNTHNVDFVSTENTSSTNDVSTAYSVSSPSVSKSQKEGSLSYTDEINDDDMEEMDLKWQVAMISIRIKKFHKRTRRKLQFDTNDPVGFDKTKDDSKALVTIDGDDIDWSVHVEEDAQNYAMMAYSSSNSGSDNKEYESNSDNDSVSNVQVDKEKPSFAFTDSVKHVKSPRENVKETGTPNHNPKVIKQDRHGPTRKGLGYDFTRKACFVCGSFSHLIRDCDFHEKRMAKQAELTKSKNKNDPHKALKDKGIVDSRCFRHMTRNKAHLADYQEFKGGFVAFEGSNKRITGKGKIKAGKKNKVLFTDTDCLVMSPDFKLPEENQKGKQHNASCKAKTMSSVNQPLQILHMDLFRPTSVRSINHKTYCLVITDGFSRLKGIKREYSNARTLQQNGIAERKNMTLIEVARTMLANSFLPTIFWAETTDCKTCEKSVSQVKKIFQEEIEKLKRQEKEANDVARKEATHKIQNANTNSTNLLNVVSTPISIVGPSRAFNDGEPSYLDDSLMPHLEDIYASPSEGIFTDSSYDDEGVVKQKEDGIFISQDKYVAEILKKFDFLSVKTASTPIETQKPLVKDEEATDVDISGYSKYFIPSSCKENLRYLKGQPKLGLWYPKVSTFNLEAYSDSDYAGADLDRKSITGGCQFLGKRLISWQCKKQTIMATSTT